MALYQSMNAPTSSRRHQIAAVARGLLLCCCVLVSGCFGKSHQETREIGYQGVARRQPYLAAERMMTTLGYEVSTIHSAKDLPLGGVLILGGEGAQNQNLGLQALNWVKQNGGHLIILLRGTESWRDDWSSQLLELFGMLTKSEAHAVLRELGIKIGSKNSFKLDTKHEVTIEDTTYSYVPKTGLTLDATSQEDDLDLVEGTASDSQLFSLPWHRGRITVMVDGSPFRNRFIDQSDHAKLWMQLLQLPVQHQYGTETVTMLFANHDTFWVLLWEKFWMVILSLLALLCFWLWRHIPRFGPLLTLEGKGLRQFSEHLRMTGVFLWNRHQTSDLLLPLRRSILTKLHLRHPAWKEADDGRLMERFATMTNLPYDRVADAWQASYVKEGPRLVSLIRDLQLIEQSL